MINLAKILTASISVSMTWGTICSSKTMHAQTLTEPPIKEPSGKTEIMATTNIPSFHASQSLGRRNGNYRSRIQLEDQIFLSNNGFDKNGNTVDYGFRSFSKQAVLTIDVRVFSQLYVNLKIPYTTRNSASLNVDTFKNSNMYKRYYESLLLGSIIKLRDTGVCGEISDCKALIQGYYAFSDDDSQLVLPSGEIFEMEPDIPIRTYLESLAIEPFRQESGETGLGDIQISTILNVVRLRKLDISFGGGIIFPTGKFTDVPSSKSTTGDGVLDLELSVNFDYSPTPPLWISIEGKYSKSINSGKRRRTSLVDSTLFNEADPTSSEAISAGSSGRPNTHSIERIGLRSRGHLMLNYSLSAVWKKLKFIQIYSKYLFEFKRQILFAGTNKSRSPHETRLLYGLSLDMSSYNFPISIDASYSEPLEGMNISYSSRKFTTSITSYF